MPQHCSDSRSPWPQCRGGAVLPVGGVDEGPSDAK